MGDVLTAITLGAVILGAIVNIVGLVSKREATVVAEARRDVKLDNILERTNSISVRQEEFNTSLQSHEIRLTKVEAKTDSTCEKLNELCTEHKLKCGT